MKNLMKLVLGSALALYGSLAWAVNEVKFQKVQSVVSTRYGQSQQNVRFEANVANLAFAKQVFAHMRRTDGSWFDLPLSFNRRISNNREIWEGSYSPPLNTPHDLLFTLKYVVNGQTYWDNNGGQNYAMARDAGSKLASGLNVYNGNYSPTMALGASESHVYGWATVRNLAFAKVVRVRYSTDNWATTKIANASYSPYFWSSWYSSATNPNQYGFEEWRFSLNVGTAATQVAYAIEYTVNGQTWWDNNYGRNYHTAIVRN